DDDQRLARMHFLPVTYADLPHDPAFLVLHGLAIELDLDLAASDYSARQRRGRGPDSHQRCDNYDRNQQATGEPGELPARVAVVIALCEQSCECHRLSAFHARASTAVRGSSDAERLTGAVTTRNACRTFVAGPKASSAPSLSATSLSSCDISAGRWP